MKHIPHRIEVSTDNCSLCNEVVDEIEAGKCAGCQLTVDNLSDERALARKYGVRVVPIVIIDGEVKIEGEPDIPFCAVRKLTHTFDNVTLLRCSWSHEAGVSGQIVTRLFSDLLSRTALVATIIDDALISRAEISGRSIIPNPGYRIPAAIGIARML